MLKQRLITAAILIPAVIWAILSLAPATLAMVLVGVAAIAAWEWSGMLMLRSVVGRIAYTVVLAGVAYSLLAYDTGMNSLVFSVAALWWCIATVWVRRYQAQQGLTSTAKSLGVVIGLLVIVPSCLAMSLLQSHAAAFLLFLIVLTSVADSGAYFAGRRWGKHKLAPVVSPGKTIEGAAGALVATLFVAVGGWVYFDLVMFDLLWFIPLCLLTVAVSIVGDLLESLFKRRAGLKDSGHILPGHGGIMDRIDSLTAAAPLFALGLMFFGMAK